MASPRDGSRSPVNSRRSQRFKQYWGVEATAWPRKRYEFLQDFYESHTEQFAELDSDIWQYYIDNQQLLSELERKYDFRERLLGLIKRKLPDWVVQVVITGSSVQGVATRGSDCDMVIYLPGALDSFKDHKECSEHILKIIIKLMNGDPEMLSIVEEAEYVDAMIPILKMKVRPAAMKDKRNSFGPVEILDVDLSVVADEFLSGLHNSRLIAGYASVDERFAPLQIFVKAWAGKNKARDPQYRRFNSYAITLLLIHFLQCGLPVPVLPNLQQLYPTLFAMDENNYPPVVDFDEKFPEPIPDDVYAEGVQKNSMPLSQLFFLFVCYYSQTSLKDNVISIRGGLLMKRSTMEIAQRWQRSEIYIQDPIDEHNPGRTVDNWKIIQWIFRDAQEIFLRAGRERALFRFPTLKDLLFQY